MILKDLIEVYNILERRVKLNKRTLFHRKVPIIFADDIGLINFGIDLVRFELVSFKNLM